MVLFDIDFTLFDTEKFLGIIYRRLAAKFKSSPNQIKKIVTEIREEQGRFNFAIFLRKLTQKFKINKNIIEKFFYDEDALKRCLYDETKEVLEAVSKVALLGIFSQGFSRFQKAKLLTLENLLERPHIHITLSKHMTLPKIVSSYKSKKLYMIDDALDVLHRAKKLNQNIFTIWVRRGRFASRQKPIPGFKPDAEVENLKSITKLITHNS